MKRAGVEQVEPTRTDGPFVSRAPKLGYFPPAAPYAFWMMTVGFGMLVLGSLLKGL